jgi:UDP-N-acetylmuramate dehydrogenase
MPRILQNVNLKPYNTFGIEAYCDFFTEIDHEKDFEELAGRAIYRLNKRLVLGGGSNLLFTRDFKGLVIKNNLKGIRVMREKENEVVVKVAAGEVWHDFVMWCISMNYAGLENLSLIPGCVGASPMQNIGAYGVEIKECFVELEALSMEDGSKRIFTKEECGFGYRESVFKHEYKDRYFITTVSYCLQKKAALNTTYGAINAELQAMNVTTPTIKDVSQAVINIRQSKLPDPKVTGNAGSFFKNPEVPAAKHDELKAAFPELVAYPLANGNFKLAAGWLIEQCGLKGYEHEGAAVHVKQALVLINKNNCSGQAVYELSGYVMQKVFDKFGVSLEREVNII